MVISEFFFVVKAEEFEAKSSKKGHSRWWYQIINIGTVVVDITVEPLIEGKSIHMLSYGL